jgi:hypothetical protein
MLGRTKKERANKKIIVCQNIGEARVCHFYLFYFSDHRFYPFSISWIKSLKQCMHSNFNSFFYHINVISLAMLTIY